MKSTFKELLTNTYNVLDSIQDVSGLDMQDMPLREAFRYELFTLLLYLAAADNRFNSAEQEYINNLLDYSYTFDDYMTYFNEDAQSITEFPKKVSLTMYITAQVDKAMRQRHPDAPLMTDCLLNLVENIGKEFQGIDNHCHVREGSALAVCLARMRECIV